MTKDKTCKKCKRTPCMPWANEHEDDFLKEILEYRMDVNNIQK